MKQMKFCRGHGCVAKEQCAWFLDTPEFIFQDFFDKTPGVNEDCKHFLQKVNQQSTGR